MGNGDPWKWGKKTEVTLYIFMRPKPAYVVHAKDESYGYGYGNSFTATAQRQLKEDYFIRKQKTLLITDKNK